METSFQRSHACTATLTAPNPAAGHHQPMPLLETLGHSQASLGQSLVGSLLLSSGSWYTKDKGWASLVAQPVKNPPAVWKPGFNPWVGKIPWRRERLPTPVSWTREFHGQYVHGVAKSQTQLSKHQVGTFKVIVDMYVPIVIFLIVCCWFCRSFFFSCIS